MKEQENHIIKSEVIEELATLSESGTWKNPLNIIQWGDNIAKYDIRSWNQDHSKSGKGITLNLQELVELKKC